jgi:hypothetical protein
MLDHIVYSEEGKSIPWSAPNDHVRVWGFENEMAVISDPALEIDPREYLKIQELEADNADILFGERYES